MKPGVIFAGLWAALAFLAAPALAGLENKVTVTGSSPGKSGDVVAEARLEVGVARAAPALTVTVGSDIGGRAAVGDAVRLTYRVENSGNVTLDGIRLEIGQEGRGSAPVLRLAEQEQADGEAAADGTEARPDEAGNAASYDGVLAPGESVSFTAFYEVVQDDLEQNGGGDGLLDSSAIATASFGEAQVRTEGAYQIALEEVRATLEVSKAADKTENVAAGEVITYTYTVTNTGNVSISAISLIESHNGSGPAPRPGDEQLVADHGITGDSMDREQDGVWDLLGPGDEISFTATYTVTQADIDTLQ